MEFDIAGKLFPNIATLIVQLLSTGVMLIVFKKFLWIPMQNYFAKRADFIESQMNEAKEMNEKANADMVESEEQARESAKEYRDIVARSKEDALKIRDDIVADAKKEATNKIEQAQKEIEAEKALAKTEMKEEMIDIAMEVATKIMNKDMNTQTNQELVEEFIDKVVN